jgi:hypothetical protein
MQDYRWLKKIFQGEAGGAIGTKAFSPATADVGAAPRTIFTITGGLVLVTAIIGVQTAVQAGGASTSGLRHSIGPTIIDAGTFANTAFAVGGVLNWTGDVTDPLQPGVLGAPIMDGKVIATAIRHAGRGAFMSAGNIQYTQTAGTGSTRWIIIYIPVDIGASIAGV